MCALLGSAASKPVAEADLRFTRSAEAEAEAKAEPDAEALRPFAYSSPSGAVSFSLGGVRIKSIIRTIPGLFQRYGEIDTAKAPS